MRFRNSLVLTAALALICAVPSYGEKAGTVSSLAALFEDAATPRQGASVPISIHHGATFAQFGGAATFAPNTFATIFGPVGAGAPGGAGSLVKRTMNWGDSFQNGAAPQNLDGIEVKIGGQNAFISFLGLGSDFQRQFDQINFISPDINSLGPGVKVEVYKDGALVGETTVALESISPALFAFGVKDGVNFLAVAQANFTAYIAPADFFGVPTVNGIPVRPTRSGEAIALFGTGFGPTDPALPAGQLNTALRRLTQTVAIRIGGLPVPAEQVLYAGLAPNLTGIYQFNVIVPTLSNGNHRVEIDIAGKSIQAEAFIPVQNP